VAFSTDVRLPRALAPVFPDRCLGCGRPSQGGTLEFASRSIGWWTPVLMKAGSRVSVAVPVCAACRPRLARQRRVRFLAAAACAVGAALAAMQVVGPEAGPARRWIAAGLALLLLAPVVAWQTWFPPALELTVMSGSVTYEFADRDYAREFERLNAGRAGPAAAPERGPS